MSKQSYAKPTLVQYGSISELTLGHGGHKPDLGTLVNNDCNASGAGGFCFNTS